MANLPVKDGNAADVYLKATGTGTNLDPYIPFRSTDDAVATIGSAIPTKGNVFAGTDGTNARVIKTDSSGELQVDVLTLPALAAGTAAIGKLAANDGVDIGDVTINNASLAVTGTFWQATQPVSGTFWQATQPVSGTFWQATQPVSVASLPSVATTNAGTFVVQENGAALTSLQLIDDIVYTDDTSTHATGTSKGALFMAAAAPTDTAVNANDIGAVGMTVNRELYVSLTTAIPAGNNNIGDVDVASIAAGTNYIGKTRITDGTNDITLRNLTNSKPLNVAITDANGDQITSFGGSGGTSMADDAAFTVATTLITPVGGTYKSVRDAVDDNDGGAFAMNAKRAMYVSLETPNSDSVLDDTLDTVKVSQATAANLNATVVGTGTFAVQAAQSGTWNVTNVSGTVSLPTGASTETTLGSVKTSVELIDDSIVADDAAFTPATTKVMMAGFTFDDVAPDSVNEGDAGAARMSANRNIYMTLRDAAGNERGANINASNQLSVSVDNTVTVGSHAVTNAGTFATQVDGAALTSLQLIDDMIYTDDTSTHATGTSKGALIMGAATPTDTSVNANDIGAIGMTNDRHMYTSLQDIAGTAPDVNSGTKSAGTLRVVLATDQPALTNKLLVTPDSVALPANQSVNVAQINGVTTLMGNGATGTGSIRVTLANDSTGIVQPVAGTSGGYTPYKLNSAGSTNATSVKGSAGNVGMISVSNINAAARYLKFYNKATAPTVGSDTPVQVYRIPGNTAGAGSNIPIPSAGLSFSTGIAFAITTGPTDADTGAVAADDIIVNLGHK